MLRKIFRINFIILFFFFIFSPCFAGEDSASLRPSSVTIGILVPLQHKALDEIVSGFEQEMLRGYKGEVHFIIKNAQGDMNIQRSILQEFAQSDVNLVVPIGTTALEMALSVVKEKPVLGLATNFTEEERNISQKKNVTNVIDEIPVARQLEFTTAVIPHLHQVALVYSSTEKSIKDADDFLIAAKAKNIAVQKLMIQQLSELYAVTQQIDRNNQAIFIEKDHLVVSGINTLSKTAAKLHLPIISADDGSVQDGAAFAVGVTEKQIGVEGAKLALKFFAGADIGKLPITTIKNLYVFINPAMAKQQGIAVESIKRVAKQSGYEVVEFHGTGGMAK